MDEKLNSTDRPIAIYYTFITNVTSYTKVGDSQCSVVISGDWNYIHTSIGTINFKERPVDGDAGLKFVSQLSATCPGQNNDTPNDISSISGRKSIFKIVYRSGKQKIVGNKEKGPKPILSSASDDKTDRLLEFDWESRKVNRWLS